jgi:hypothetical protein
MTKPRRGERIIATKNAGTFSEPIEPNPVLHMVLHAKHSGRISYKVVFQAVGLFFQRDFLVRSASQESAHISFRESTQPKVLVLHCVHKFVE